MNMTYKNVVQSHKEVLKEAEGENNDWVQAIDKYA